MSRAILAADNDSMTLAARLWSAAKTWALAPEKASDEALLESARRGDEIALGRLVVRHELALYRYCLGYLHDPDQARAMAGKLLSPARIRTCTLDRNQNFQARLFRLAKARCIRAILQECMSPMRSVQNFAN